MLSAETLATQYISGKAAEPTMREVMDFTQWVDSQYSHIERYVDFTSQEVEPNEMLWYWDSFARIRVSTAHNDHPYWAPDVNAKFRAIHDWHHIQGGFGFYLAGELCAAGYAMSTAPESIRWILWSEVALQAASAIHTGTFQEQKLVRV